jgi:hypothetical protein
MRFGTWKVRSIWKAGSLKTVASGLPLERLRRRWGDNIRMDLRKIEWEGVDWMHLAQDREQWRTLVNTVMNLRVQ